MYLVYGSDSGSITKSGAGWVNLITLASGYRPSEEATLFCAWQYNGINYFNSASVGTDGLVRFWFNPATGGGNTINYISIYGTYIL